MATNLYMLNGEKVRPMAETAYETEDDLQHIIELNPQLLLPDSSSQQLYLVKREFQISEDDTGSNSFSLDHLFIRKDGVPVLCEVKRSSDTRIRREVIAQMFDYACRAHLWNIADLRASFPKDSPEHDSDEFWDRVAANLKAERLCLVFAADRIPDSLRQIIAFVNRSMPDIEAYGVEIRQFLSNGDTMLSSTVIGQKSIEEKKQSLTYEWTADRMSSAILSNYSEAERVAFMEIQSYAARNNLDCTYGKGSKRGTFTVKRNGITIFCLNIESVHACFEIGTYDLAKLLSPEWSEEQIRDLFWSIPEANATFMRNTAQNLYIDIAFLSDINRISSFESAISTLANAVSASTK